MRERDYHDRKRNFWLWLGMLGPAVVWLIYLEVAYLLIHFACKTGNRAPLHIASVAFLLCSIFLGLLAWRERPATSEPSGDMEDKTVNRIRLMTSLGIMASIEFTLIIAGSWIAMFILTPCQS